MAALRLKLNYLLWMLFLKQLLQRVFQSCQALLGVSFVHLSSSLQCLAKPWFLQSMRDIIQSSIVVQLGSLSVVC
ncbi:hypothetical protein B0H14DRAFT_2911528 [Mycena olivaceomarginata]|nr:hypothetical protein B0H14DRAFT_2911528 [Mycena olivaceomarginata]